MTALALTKALQQYDIKKRSLEPSRYEAIRDFRDMLPELYPEMDFGAPGGPDGPGGPGGPDGPGGPGGKPMGGPPGMNQALSNIMTALLKGETVDNNAMVQELGFSYDELSEAMKAADPVKKPIPRGLVLMTFDDSTIDHYTVAAPVLEKYGGKGIFFTTEMANPMGGGPGFEDKSLFMTWEQIRDLHDRGHEIANHSWHHPVNLYSQDDEAILEEIRGIDRRCEEYGIPKPITFGYPGGGCTRHMEDILRAEGYRWGRGELKGAERVLMGSAPYDPYLDTPMIVPNVAAMCAEDFKTLIDATEGGKILLMVKHQVDGSGMMPEPMPFEDQIKAIYDNGGRCITFRELEEYIDPEKAYAYTH